MRDRGIRFMPNYGRQAYNVDGRFKFFGGVVIFANGGGRAHGTALQGGGEARHRGPLQTRATALLQGSAA